MAYKEILAVNFNDDRSKQLKILGMFAKAKVRIVAEEEKDQSIGSLLGLTAEEIASLAALAKDIKEDDVHGDETSDTDIPVTKEAIVLLGFDQTELSKTLEAIRRGPLKQIPLKAAVTPNNISWTIHKLLGELAKENAYFAAQKKKK